MNEDSNRTTTARAQLAQVPYADAGDAPAPLECECEFCSPEPEPIPAPWERTGDEERDQLLSEPA